MIGHWGLEEGSGTTTATAWRTIGRVNGGSFNPVALLVENGISENNNAAAQLLNKYVPADRKHSADALLAWGKLYRGWRDLGSPPEAAAKNATEGVPLE